MKPLPHPLFRFEESPIVRFVTCIGRGLARIFWNWTFLKFILVSVTLVILFYVEEDWRGARAWAATKAEWEAKGETFDLNKFTPPPVPDDQNLGALPLFKLEMTKASYGNSYLSLVTLNRAMRSDLPNIEIPPLGNSQKGGLPDMAKIQKVIATDYAAAFKDAKPPDDDLAQFDAIYPFLSDLRAAAVTRPFFRLLEDYTISPPVLRYLSPVTDQIKLSHILTLHAVLALDHHQSDLALEDIKINFKITSGVKRDPSLVGGLVAIGMTAIDNEAIYDGLAQHEWSDAQLVEIDDTLKPINFLADYQFAMRSEAVNSVANSDYLEKEFARRSNIFGWLQGPYGDLSLMFRVVSLWPAGWWKQNKSQIANPILRTLATVNPQSRLVFPKVDIDLKHQIEQAKARWDAEAPWNFWFTMAAGPVTGATHQFAQGQVRIDEARIACALERYRLAHGVYPDSLDSLAPACIDQLPHDIMNGRPYHYSLRYSLRPDGTYLLYSVGWNQTDDGGKVVYMKDSPERLDFTQGDWIWPTPQANAQK